MSSFRRLLSSPSRSSSRYSSADRDDWEYLRGRDTGYDDADDFIDRHPHGMPWSHSLMSQPRRSLRTTTTEATPRAGRSA